MQLLRAAEILLGEVASIPIESLQFYCDLNLREIPYLENHKILGKVKVNFCISPNLQKRPRQEHM